MVEAVLTNSTTIVRTAGASDGATAISWQIVSSTSAHWQQAFESFALAEWNAVTGSNVTVTLLAIANMAALPNNDDIWPEVHYFGNAASPIGSVVAATKANVLADNAALTADTSAWDTKATARSTATPTSQATSSRCPATPVGYSSARRAVVRRGRCPPATRRRSTAAASPMAAPRSAPGCGSNWWPC